MAWSRGKAYGQDLRDRAFAMADDGFAVGQVAELLRVSISYVSKALSRRRRTGETAARPQCCHVGLKLAALREKSRLKLPPNRMSRSRNCAVGWSHLTKRLRATD